MMLVLTPWHLEHRRRKVEFDVEALFNVVVGAVPGAESCVDIQRLGEGDHGFSASLSVN